MEVLFVVVLMAFAAVISRQRLLRPRDLQALPDPDRLAALAANVGLEHFGHGRAGGELDGFTIEIVEAEEDRHSFEIDGRGRIPELRLFENAGVRSSEEEGAKHRRAVGGSSEEEGAKHRRAGGGSRGSIETSDRFFDERFNVFAPRLAACALLDGEVRHALMELGCVDIQKGVLRASITASRLPSLERAFRQLLEVARLLSADDSYEERLAKIATSDQNPFVRLHALSLLTGERPHSPSTENALWLAVDDPHVPVALYAAITLGARVAGKHLKRLARLAASADEERIAAFQELLLHEEIEEMLPLLLEASRSFYGRFSARALRWAVQYGGRKAMLALLSAPGSTHPENLIAFVEETGRMLWDEAGTNARLDAEMEQAVLRLVLDTRARLTKARAAAAKLLGAFGSPAALPALKEIAKGELGATAEVARMARDAIARIQAKKSALAGGLSVVEEGSAGDLSFSENASGALSPLPSGPDAETSP